MERKTLLEPEWEIKKTLFFERIGLSERNFKKLLYLPDFRKVNCVVPLKSLVEICSIIPLIQNVIVPFPCGTRSWEEIRVISLAEKPADINDRYFDLTKELFRDLKYLGIDG